MLPYTSQVLPKEIESRKGKKQRMVPSLGNHPDEVTAPLRDSSMRTVCLEGGVAVQTRPSSQLSTLAAAVIPSSLAAMGSAGLYHCYLTCYVIDVYLYLLLFPVNIVNRSQPLPSLSQSTQQSQGGLTVALSQSRDDVGKTMQIFSFRKNAWEKLEVWKFKLHFYSSVCHWYNDVPL